MTVLLDHEGRPLVQESTYERDPTEFGEQLRTEEPRPIEAGCPCGKAFDAEGVAATRDLAFEVEAVCRCGRVYAVRGGRIWGPL